MLDRSCAATPPIPVIGEPIPGQPISARIALSGTFAAECVVEFPPTSAARLTTAFLGPQDAPWEDAMVADAVGEMCNLIAGGWKKRLGQLAWGADLSVPSISTRESPGTDRPLQADANTLARTYAFDGSPFVVHLTLLERVQKWNGGA
jgi:chemotaxis protein CheX